MIYGWSKWAVFVVCLMPFLLLGVDIWHENLGANPVETLHFRLGDWALRFICLTLALTPLKQLTGQRWINRFRRMLGLFAFFYASMHLLTYLLLDIALSWDALADDIRETPYILLGLLTFLQLLPLAATSTQRMQRRLGKQWKTLHRLIYPAAITAVLHYALLVKADFSQPLIYAAVVSALLGYRVIRFQKNRRRILKSVATEQKKKAVKLTATK